MEIWSIAPDIVDWVARIIVIYLCSGLSLQIGCVGSFLIGIVDLYSELVTRSIAIRDIGIDVARIVLSRIS